MLTKLFAPLIDRLVDKAVAAFLALIPVLAAAVTKAITEAIPDIPVVGDVAELTETVRQEVGKVVPDIDLPVISDVVRGATGFDLTDWLRGKQ